MLSGLMGSSAGNAFAGAAVAAAGSESKSSSGSGSSGSSNAGASAATRAASAAMAPVLAAVDEDALLADVASHDVPSAGAASADVPVDEPGAGAGVAVDRAPVVGVVAEVDQRPEVDEAPVLVVVAEDALLAEVAADGVPGVGAASADVAVDDAGAGGAARRSRLAERGPTLSRIVRAVAGGGAGAGAGERVTVGEVLTLYDDCAELVEFAKTVGRGGGFAAGGGAAAGAGRAGGTVGIADFERGLLGIAVRALVLLRGAEAGDFFATAVAAAVADVGCVADEGGCVPDEVVDAGFDAAAGRAVDAWGVTGLADRALANVEEVRAVVWPAFAEVAPGFAAL